MNSAFLCTNDNISSRATRRPRHPPLRTLARRSAKLAVAGGRGVAIRLSSNTNCPWLSVEFHFSPQLSGQT
jgi:hypothetical protein